MQKRALSGREKYMYSRVRYPNLSQFGAKAFEKKRRQTTPLKQRIFI